MITLMLTLTLGEHKNITVDVLELDWDFEHPNNPNNPLNRPISHIDHRNDIDLRSLSETDESSISDSVSTYSDNYGINTDCPDCLYNEPCYYHHKNLINLNKHSPTRADADSAVDTEDKIGVWYNSANQIPKPAVVNNLSRSRSRMRPVSPPKKKYDRFRKGMKSPRDMNSPRGPVKDVAFKRERHYVR